MEETFCSYVGIDFRWTLPNDFHVVCMCVRDAHKSSTTELSYEDLLVYNIKLVCFSLSSQHKHSSIL